LRVLTVTLNPALDRELVVENFTINNLHRVKNQKYSIMEPGGKGINVSLILSGFGIPSIAMGFIGGYIGAVVESRLRNLSDLVTTNFINVEEETRENITIIDPASDTITEINSQGPFVDKRDIDKFMKRYLVSLGRVNAVVISGSVPPGIPEDFYYLLGNTAKEAGKLVVSESIGACFEYAVKRGAFTVARPDLRSDQKLFGQDLEDLDDYVEAGKKIVESGAKMAILSYEIEGDVIATEEGVWFFKTHEHVERSHLLGTGDSFVAGVVEHLLKHPHDYLNAAKRGMAAAITEAAYLGKERITLDDVETNLTAFDISRLR